MNDRELYQQKKQAQLDEWKAGIDKLRAQASMASADVQIEMHKQLKVLEGKMEEGKSKLSEFAKASEDTFESMKKGVESAWDSTKTAFNDMTAKFKS